MKSIKRLAFLSMMLALAIVLNIVESFLPVFIPGVKLGLANIIILILLYEFSSVEAFWVDVLRIVLVGLIRGTFLSPTFFMSLSGGILSYLVMLIFTKINCFSVIGVSVLGAISHSIGQIAVAIWLLGTSAVIYYLPWIALLSVLTGILSGIITRLYLKRNITGLFLKKQ